MRRMSKKTLIALSAALLVIFTSVGVSLAYFSDYEMGYGDVTLHLSKVTEIEEHVHEGDKTISIRNTGDGAVVLRVGIIGSELMKVSFDAPSDWETHGDFYYYTKVLEPGESTSAIQAKLSLTDEQKEQLGGTFDITVVHESELAVYDKTNTVKKPEAWDYLPAIKAQ